MAEPKEPLTERELEIVRLVGTGAGNKEIATQLFLSPNTVKVHLRNIFTKLEAKSRTEVTMVAVRSGWIALAQAASVPDGHDRADATELPPIQPVQHSGQSADNSVATSTDDATAQVVEPPVVDVIPPSPPPAMIVPVAPNPQPLPHLALWQRLALLGAAIVALMLIGLSVPANQTSASGSFDPLRIGPSQPRNSLLLRGEASRWHLRAPLPAARARSAAVAVNDRIFVIGGEVDQAVSGDVMIYEPITNTWTVLGTPKPTPVANAAAAVVDGRIYMAGGTGADGNATTNLEAFDTASRQWRALAPLKQPVSGHALAGVGNQLFLFGGANQQGVTGASSRYDIVTNTWHPIAAMPTPRTLAAAATLNERIYVIGGYSSGRELSTCEYYQPATDTWGPCAPMTVPRSGLGLARVGSSLFAIGGGISGFIGFNERYDAATDRWTPLETPLTSDWQSVAVAARQTEFYVFGGYSNGERLAFTYVYEVFTNRVFVPAFQSPGTKDRKP